MKSAIAVILMLVLVTMIACSKDDEKDNPYPVWILYARVVEEISDIGIPYAPVRGCPQGIYHILPNGPDSTVNCWEGNTNLVKLWQHLEGTVTIEYYVRCPNYYDSAPKQVTFHAENAVQLPGREGPEDMETDTVILVPH